MVAAVPWLTESLSNSAMNAASERAVSRDAVDTSSSCFLVSHTDFVGHAGNLTVDDPGGGGKKPPPVFTPPVDLIFRDEAGFYTQWKGAR